MYLLSSSSSDDEFIIEVWHKDATVLLRIIVQVRFIYSSKIITVVQGYQILNVLVQWFSAFFFFYPCRLYSRQSNNASPYHEKYMHNALKY